MTLALVALAAALGAAARYVVQVAVTARAGRHVAWGTWVVNVTGSLALGLLLGLAVAGGVGATYTTVVGTGFLGAYTTFSTWMYESVRLLERRAFGAAAWNLLGSWSSGVAAAALGLWLGARA